MIMAPLDHVIALSSILFAIGAVGVVTRRNLIVILMSIELMLNAVNLAFVGFNRLWPGIEGTPQTVAKAVEPEGDESEAVARFLHEEAADFEVVRPANSHERLAGDLRVSQAPEPREVRAILVAEHRRIFGPRREPAA